MCDTVASDLLKRGVMDRKRTELKFMMPDTAHKNLGTDSGRVD